MAKPPEHQTPRAKEAPLVSVVTPVYNGGEYLVECIKSVIGQSYQNWEYLLVDNASTDVTPELFPGSQAKIRASNICDLRNTWEQSTITTEP